MAKLFESVRFLKGVGEARAKSFASIGVRTLYDLISTSPGPTRTGPASFPSRSCRRMSPPASGPS